MRPCAGLALAMALTSVVLSAAVALYFVLVVNSDGSAEGAGDLSNGSAYAGQPAGNNGPATFEQLMAEAGLVDDPNYVSLLDLPAPSEGQAMRITPVVESAGLSGEKAEFLEEMLVPLGVAIFTRLFSLKYPTSGAFRLPRRCATSMRWNTGLSECMEVVEGDTCGELQIPEKAWEGRQVCSGDFPGDCRDLPAGEGYADTDFLLFVTAVDTGGCGGEGEGGEAGEGGYCFQDPATGRPLAGFVNFCPQALSTDLADLGQLLDTMVHELIHATIFEPSLFDAFIDEDGRRRGASAVQVSQGPDGSERRRVTTPKVAEVARQHFGCPSLDGADLENQGGQGTAWSHWEEAILYNELMTGLMTGQRRSALSNFTLALMEDSGWYSPNYSYAAYMPFGKDAGCDFVEYRCNHPDKQFPAFYCTESAEQDQGCTFNDDALGVCSVNPLGDGCSMVKGYDNYVCVDQSQARERAPLQRFGPSSVCVVGDGEGWRSVRRESTGIATVRVVTSTYPEGSTGCFEFDCESGEPSVVLGGKSLPCEPGSTISLPDLDMGFTDGTFGPCPSADICSGVLSCESVCRAHGECHAGQCYCHLGWTGESCSVQILPQALFDGAEAAGNDTSVAASSQVDSGVFASNDTQGEGFLGPRSVSVDP